MTSRLSGFDPGFLRPGRPAQGLRTVVCDGAVDAGLSPAHSIRWRCTGGTAIRIRHRGRMVELCQRGHRDVGTSSTHIDALGNLSRNDCLHGGIKVSAIETRDGYRELNAANIPPILQPAVVLDVAAARNVDCLETGEEIAVSDIEKALSLTGGDILAGDAVLIRTGWSKHWSDAETFNGRRCGLPGPGETAARWLVSRGATLVGSDTPGFECLPTPGVSVHAILLVDEGIHIMENLNLDEIARLRRPRVIFVALPLRLVGSTGSPIRPIAIA